MGICLVIVLAAVPVLGMRRLIPPVDRRVNVIDAGSGFGESQIHQVADIRTTSLLQHKPPAESANQSINWFQKDKAVIAAAIARSRLLAQREFEALLQAAVTDTLVEARAAAQAAHDLVFHQGYYREVKARTAAKEAAEAAEKTTRIVLEKAKMVSKESALKTLLKHTDLGIGGGQADLLHDIRKQVDEFLDIAKEQCRKYPEIGGVEEFLELVTAMKEQVKAGWASFLTGQPFDNEAMTKLILGIIRMLVRAMYLEYKIEHEAHSLKRVLHQDIDIEMSDKMKSEVGLHAFLVHLASMEDASRRFTTPQAALEDSQTEQGKPLPQA